MGGVLFMLYYPSEGSPLAVFKDHQQGSHFLSAAASAHFFLALPSPLLPAVPASPRDVF